MEKNMRKIPVKLRIAIVSSAVWFTFFFFFAISDWSKDGPLGLMIGLLPIMILWGILWIIDGYTASKKQQDTIQAPAGFSGSEKKVGD